MEKFSIVKDKIKNLGVVLISENYINAKQKLTLKCKCGAIFEKSYDKLRLHPFCQKCEKEKMLSNKRLPVEKILKVAEKWGFRIISGENDYRNSDSLLEYYCSCGNKAIKPYWSIQRGLKCKICQIQNPKFSEAKVNSFFEKEGCRLLSKYKNANSHMDYICNCGRITQTTYQNFKQGIRCKACGILKNSGEKHYNFNPNLTQEDREVKRFTKEYERWRRKVRKRDNYTCQKCYKTNTQIKTKLHTHHIESFGDNILLRTELSNGITFCENCHRLFHIQYGNRNIGLNHLEKFLKEA